MTEQERLIVLIAGNEQLKTLLGLNFRVFMPLGESGFCPEPPYIQLKALPVKRTLDCDGDLLLETYRTEVRLTSKRKLIEATNALIACLQAENYLLLESMYRSDDRNTCGTMNLSFLIERIDCNDHDQL